MKKLHDLITQELIKAALVLFLPCYKRFKSCLQRTHSDWSVIHSKLDNVDIVNSLQNPDAPNHVFRLPADQCDCSDRI